jgi:hypothetical protein
MKYAVITSAIVIALVCLFALTTCNGSKGTQFSEYELTGGVAERVARVSAAMAKHKAPSTPILDAHFIEEQSGDGQLGPSDFTDFYHIQVATQDVDQWTKILTPITDPSGGKGPKLSRYTAPKHPRDWWISRDAFGSLEFYEQSILANREQGWIGVSRQTGHIYIFAYTM